MLSKLGIIIFLVAYHSVLQPLFFCLTFLNRKLKKRWQLEKQSWKELEKKSFKRVFHCSSEGEFEQLLPLIQKCLAKSEFDILICYTSLSVQAKVFHFTKEHKISSLLFPLISLSIFQLCSFIKILSARYLYLCRYENGTFMGNP